MGALIVVSSFILIVAIIWKFGLDEPLELPVNPRQESQKPSATVSIAEQIVTSQRGWQALNLFWISNWDERALQNGDFVTWHTLHTYGLLPVTYEIKEAIITALNSSQVYRG